MKNKYTLSTFLIMAVISIGLIITAIFFTSSLNKMLSEENHTYLSEIATQTASSVRNKLNGDLQMLRSMAFMLNNQETVDVDFWISTLKDEGLFKEFQRIGIILPNGQGYGQDVSGTNFSDREYFKQAMAGNYYISDILMDKTTLVPSTTYAVPVYKDGQVVAVLAAVIHSDTYQQVMLQNGFGGKSYNYILNQAGEIMLHSALPEETTIMGSFFDIPSAPPEKIARMKANLKNGAAGNLDYSVYGKRRLLSYVPIGINNWTLVSVIPYETVAQKSQSIMRLVYMGSCFVILAIVLLLIHVHRANEKNKKALAKLAYKDELTGIANKILFKQIGSRLLTTSKTQYAYIILNINKFSRVNDMFGYVQGDLLLQHVSLVLKAALLPDEIASRYTADHFHMLLKYKNKTDCAERIQKIADEIALVPFAAEANYFVTASFGVYVIENPNELLDAIGDKAEQALRKVKGLHISSAYYYNDSIRSQVILEQEIETDMLLAIKNGDFKVYLQPKINLASNKVEGAEALVRWHHTKGIISPDLFIPIFEKNGFITTLDFYMLTCVCEKMQYWMQNDLPYVPVSVNQSRAHLYNSDYVHNLLHVVRKHHVPPHLIEIEITESVFFEDNSLMIERMKELHNAGFKISMDDFGSGYSSLNMLQNLMVDELKIDRNFFSESANSNRGKIIVSNVISMAKELSIQIVAEGVETKDQEDFLKQNGCDIGQGYFYSRPIPIDEFERLYLLAPNATVYNRNL